MDAQLTPVIPHQQDHLIDRTGKTIVFVTLDLTEAITLADRVIVFAGLKISVASSLVGAVVAELISANRGLGSILATTSSMFDTAGLFAGLAMLLVIALTMNGLVDRLEKRHPRRKLL